MYGRLLDEDKSNSDRRAGEYTLDLPVSKQLLDRVRFTLRRKEGLCHAFPSLNWMGPRPDSPERGAYRRSRAITQLIS
ncbi:hypothetical protein KCP70_02595 [Salmonella enterica subsp. enterica]|nr:hypothetical protein KCP70_02595 [Salmonella enterica subsp. enterica]